MNFKLPGVVSLTVVEFFASSAESVGRFGLGKFSELMKQCDLNGFKLFEAVRFSHGQFGFVVEAFDNA